MATRRRNPDPAAVQAARSGRADSARPAGAAGEGTEEQALRFAREMIEVLPVPVFFKARDGKYLGVNRTWEQFFGVARDEFVGKEVHDLYPQSPAVADKHYSMDQELWRNPGSQSYEIPIVTRDGRLRHTIYYKATFKREDGGVAGIVGTIIDITERKHAEQSQAIEFAVTRLLAQANTIEEVMPEVIRTLCQGLGYAYGARWVLSSTVGSEAWNSRDLKSRPH